MKNKLIAFLLILLLSIPFPSFASTNNARYDDALMRLTEFASQSKVDIGSISLSSVGSFSDFLSYADDNQKITLNGYLGTYPYYLIYDTIYSGSIRTYLAFYDTIPTFNVSYDIAKSGYYYSCSINLFGSAPVKGANIYSGKLYVSTPPGSIKITNKGTSEATPVSNIKVIDGTLGLSSCSFIRAANFTVTDTTGSVLYNASSGGGGSAGGGWDWSKSFFENIKNILSGIWNDDKIPSDGFGGGGSRGGGAGRNPSEIRQDVENSNTDKIPVNPSTVPPSENADVQSHNIIIQLLQMIYNKLSDIYYLVSSLGSDSYHDGTDNPDSGGILSGIASIFESFFSGMSKLLTTIVNVIGALGSSLLDAISELGGAIIEAITSLGVSILDGIKEIFIPDEDELKAVFDNLNSMIETKFGSVDSGALPDIVGKAKQPDGIYAGGVSHVAD